jgi:hypothetical protein
VPCSVSAALWEEVQRIIAATRGAVAANMGCLNPSLPTSRCGLGVEDVRAGRLLMLPNATLRNVAVDCVSVFVCLLLRSLLPFIG